MPSISRTSASRALASSRSGIARTRARRQRPGSTSTRSASRRPSAATRSLDVPGRTLLALTLASGLAACNVEPTAHDECHATLSALPSCPAAALVVMSDYVSTQIALTKLSGDTLCGSYFSTARAEATPVAFALSGDVVLPSSRPPSGRAVVIDRYGTNVLSFLVADTGALLGQLAVGTGFESNPQDYLELDE